MLGKERQRQTKNAHHGHIQGVGWGKQTEMSMGSTHLVKALLQSFIPVSNLDPQSQEFLRLSYSPNLVS